MPVAKRTISGALAYDSDLMSLLDKIDDMDNKDNCAEGTDAINEFDCEIGFSAVLKSIITKAEIGLKAQAHNDGESTNEKGCNHQMGSIKGEDLRERNSEATSSVCDIKGFKDFDDVGAEIGIFEDHIRPHEFGIIINYIEGDSIANTMDYSDTGYGYADTGYGYAETTEDFYGSLWDNDIWQLNESPEKN